MRMVAALLALIALLLPAPAGAQIRLPSIKNKLIELALDQISSPGSFEVTAGAIEDAPDGATSLLDVKVSDGAGVWLTLERLTFAWQPDRLLSGELAISRLELTGLTVARPPAADAEPPELKPQEPWSKGIFDWPRAPIAVVVEGVRLDRVTIAEGVLPQAISFDAAGRALDKGDRQELALSLTRTDAVAGRIALTMLRDFAAGTVKLDVAAEEAPGGMVAAAAGMPSDAPARLKLSADGPPADWRVSFDAAVERVFDATGRATLAYADRLSVDADFSIAPGPELGAELRTVLGERARLVARVIEQPDGMIEVVAGELTSPALTLNASGAVATGAGASDLSVSLVALAPLAELTEGVAFDRLTFEGRVTGPKGALAAEGALGLAGLRTAAADAGLLALDGQVAQTAGGLTFDLAGRGEGLRIDRVGPEAIGPARLEAAGTLDGELLTLGRTALDSRALRVAATGTYDLAAARGALTATLSAPEIAPVVAAYGAAARGAVAASADLAIAGGEVEAALSAELRDFTMDRAAAGRVALRGRVTGSEDALAFDLEGNGEALALDRIPGELTREVSLDARGGLRDGVLGLDALRLVSPLVTAEASGTLAPEAGTFALDYAVSTAELAPVAAAYAVEAEGALEASGRAEGSFAEPRLAGRAEIAGAAFGGKPYGGVALDHDATLGRAPEGSLTLAMRGSWLGDGSAETGFRLDGASLSLEGLKAQLLGASLSGRAAIDLDTALVDGAFDVGAGDLGPAAGIAGIALAGAASGRVTMTPAGAAQDLAADLALEGLAAEGAAVDAAKLRLRVADLRRAPRIDMGFEASEVRAAGMKLAALKAAATGPLRAIEFSAEAAGAVGDDALAASLAGRADMGADMGGDVALVTLAKAELTAGPDRARLRAPLRLRIGGGTVEATGLDLALPEEAALTGAAALRPGGYTGDLTLTRLPLELLERWAGAPVLGGRLDARAAFDTRVGRAGAELAVEAQGAVFDKTQRLAGGLDLDADASWDGARLDAEAEIRGDFGAPARARLALPLRPGPGGIPEISRQGTLDGAVTWAGDIGELWALVPAASHVLDGRTDIDLRLGGSIEAPRVSGRAEVTGGQYQNLDLGTILTDLTLATTIAEDGTVNVALDASDGAKGTVGVGAALQLGAAPTLDATATIKRAVLVRRDDVTAKISGDLAAAGPLTDLALTGRLEVEKAEVRLVVATPPGVVELEGVRVKGAPVPEDEGAGMRALALDLVIEADHDIFVRGRGLDSEWGMNLAVTGDASAPVVTGTVEKVRGTLDLLGRPFDLARGKVTFPGEREIDPLLDVLLELEANGIRGGIVVEGRASEPELRFVSVPALPEDEVLPRLLFGRSRQSLSGPEAIQLGTGIATLLSGSAGPLDTVRETMGIDILRVEGTSVEEASVTVGRNVAEGVFIGARQGLGKQGTAVTVEVELFEGVTVDSEVDPEGGSNVGITLRKDF